MENNELIKLLDYDKIKISWNKNPIKMDLFLSFINIKTDKVKKHLGSCTGWTLYENKEHELEIGGGWVDENEYLNTIKYGVKLSNPYNNYVNPFYLFEHLNKKGREFFLKYYKSDINSIINERFQEIKELKLDVKGKTKTLDILKLQVIEMKSLTRK